MKLRFPKACVLSGASFTHFLRRKIRKRAWLLSSKSESPVLRIYECGGELRRLTCVKAQCVSRAFLRFRKTDTEGSLMSLYCLCVIGRAGHVVDVYQPNATATKRP